MTPKAPPDPRTGHAFGVRVTYGFLIFSFLHQPYGTQHDTARERESDDPFFATVHPVTANRVKTFRSGHYAKQQQQFINIWPSSGRRGKKSFFFPDSGKQVWRIAKARAFYLPSSDINAKQQFWMGFFRPAGVSIAFSADESTFPRRFSRNLI